MNPVFGAVSDHFLTTRSWFWWGNEKKESVSKPYVHSTVAMRIGPGAKAQPLHRDDYISHNIHQEVSEWIDERDMNRESAVGFFVAGTKVTKENGGTQFIPKSHLWYVRFTLSWDVTKLTFLWNRGTDREEPPRVEDCIFAEMDKGDAFIMLASAFHGGGENITKDQRRLIFSTFIVRGHLRQEENQYLAVPKDIARGYDRAVQRMIGYGLNEPACGVYEMVDPVYALYPEKLKDARPQDF